LFNNLEPLKILNIPHKDIVLPINIKASAMNKVKKKLEKLGIKNFLIFHPAAQYQYKVYPNNLRNTLLELLNRLKVPIIVTGSNARIDTSISRSLLNFEYIYNFIGKTTIEEYIALSKLSIGYIGMDTLNMHIASSQNKRVFAIFGPTNLSTWSPWSNHLKICAGDSLPVQTYGEITIFQADLPCVPCGKAGCNDQHDKSLCLDHINPELVYREIRNFVNNQKI